MYFFNFGVFFLTCRQCQTTLSNKNNIDHGMEWKSQKGFAQSRRAIITRIGSVERGHYKAFTGVICKKSYELVHFLQSYDVN